MTSMLLEPDPRFRDFHAGDQIGVVGKVKKGEIGVLSPCQVTYWKARYGRVNAALYKDQGQTSSPMSFIADAHRMIIVERQNVF